MRDEKIDLSELALDREQTPAASGRSRSRISLFSKWLVPLLVLAGFGAVIYWAVLPGLVSGMGVTVVKVRVEQGIVSREGTPLFRASGWVEPRPTQISVSSLISGTVDQLLVVEDQPVKKGDVIATLIDEDALLKLREAEAELMNKQAQLEQVQVRLKAAEVDYEQPVDKQLAIARVEQSLAEINTRLSEIPEQIIQAEASLAFAIQDLNTKKGAGTAISRIDVEKATSVHLAAVARLRELQLRRTGLEKQKFTVESEREAALLDLELNNDAANEMGQARAAEKVAQAQLDLAQVKLEEAELQLERTRIVSPADGKVMKLMTSPGGHLSGGPGIQGSHTGAVAVTMYDPQSLQIRVDVRFEDVRRVTLGQGVLIESAAFSEPLRGEVLRMNPVADIQKNTLEVKVSIEGAVEILKPEMLMNVTFLSPRIENSGQEGEADESTIFVPDELVHREADSTYVWVVDGATGRAKQQSVVVDSVVVDGWVEVVQGLNVSSQVIKSSRKPLTVDTRVTISEFEQN